MTVVIPTRDRWHLLANTLAGVLRQREVDFEVVVVDDGSRDATVLGLAELGDPRVRCISHPSPTGVARARNRGIAEARGRWVAFLDDDDLWSPRKLSAQLETAAGTGARFIYCSAVVVDARRKVLLADPAPPPHDLAKRLLTTNLIPAGSSNVLVERVLVERVGGFDERLASLADWDLWIRLCSRAPAAACEEPLVAYVEHSGNMHTMDLEGRRREFSVLAEKNRLACEALAISFGGTSVARHVALHQRASGRRLGAAQTYLRAAVAHRRPDLLGRAAGALLGERLNQLGRRARGASGSVRPDWLDLFG